MVKVEKEWYDPTWLLTTLGREGSKIAVCMASSMGRAPGKTYSFCKFILEHATFKGKRMRDDRQFALFCRKKNQVGKFAVGALSSVMDDNWPHVSIIEHASPDKSHSDIYFKVKVASEWTDEGEEIPQYETYHVGFVIALAAAGTIKTQSSKFRKVDYVLFDEFIPDGNETYISNEIANFKNIMGSISRGGGSSARFIKILMTSNTVQFFNPYFEAFGLLGEVLPNTKRIARRGVAFEMVNSDRVMAEQDKTPLAMAFGGSLYTEKERGWRDQSGEVVCKPDRWGYSRLLAGISSVYFDDLAIYYYPAVSMFYVKKMPPDVSGDFQMFRAYGSDPSPYTLLKGSYTAGLVREAFENGNVRFDSLGTLESFVRIV